MATEDNFSAQLDQLQKQHALFVRAVKGSLSLILITLAVMCFRAALSIPAMADLLRDMLPGKPLPVLTRFVLGNTSILLLSAVLLGAIGLTLLLFSKAPGQGIVMATVVSVILFVEWQVIVTAVQLPLTHLHGIGGDPGVDRE